MPAMISRFNARLWLYSGDAPWHFVTLPADVADEVRAVTGPRRGFGSVRVRASIGNTTWDTSIFPDKESGSYLLPVRQQTRRAEGIAVDDEVSVTIELVSPGTTPRRSGT